MKSTRLPLKLLREVEGRPIFAHLIDRLKLAKSVSQIVVCTSTNPQDDPLEEIAAAAGVACYRGDEDDVVKRLLEAATKHDLDYVLSMTGDCPFCDPEYADSIVDAYRETKADLIRALDLPHGAFSYGVNPQAFRKIMEIKGDTDTEVWGRYLTDTDLFTVYDLPITNPLHNQPDVRMTLDYPEDLDFFKAVFAALYVPGKVFSLDEILTFLKDHPEVAAINSFRKRDYLKRWTRQSFIQLKSRYSVNRAVIIGSGENREQYIRSLRQFGVSEIAVMQPHAEEASYSESSVKRFSNWAELQDFKPDVALVSNPTNQHLDAISNSLPVVRGLFVQKPLASSLSGVRQLLQEITNKRLVSFVAYHLQFHPAIKQVLKILNSGELGSPIVFQAQAGQLDKGCSDNEHGVGVSLHFSDELHLAAELLGPVRGLFAISPTSALMDVDSDVISDVVMEHSSGGISQIHLDLIQRPVHRVGIVSCELGWVSYDLVNGNVVSQTAEQPSPVVVWEDSKYDQNKSIDAEMETFLNYVREGRVRHEYDAWKGARTLAIIEAALASIKSKGFQQVERKGFQSW